MVFSSERSISRSRSTVCACDQPGAERDERLRSAMRSVDVTMYSFTYREIAEELVELQHSSVRMPV